MRKSFIIVVVAFLLASCHSRLVISDVRTNNISNIPSEFLPDSAILSLVEPYKLELQEDMSRVISITEEEMYKKKPESNLTNYLSDLLLNEGISYCKKMGYAFQPQVAYVNYGGIRASLPKGEITVGNIFELMPFENEMVILEITGSDLRKFAEHVARRGGDGVAGVKIGIKDGLLKSVEVNGSQLKSNASYFLVTNDYVASGGDDMKMFSNRKKFIDTGLKIRDLIIDNMVEKYEKGEKIASAKDGRIYYED